MPAPFYNCIKGTTAGTPGTGAFTPNAASSGFLAWSTVPTGWIGIVRYEDGSAWELQYSYWNGTTLSRASTQFIASSSGSNLTLTSAATAALVVDGSEIQPELGGSTTRFSTPSTSATAAAPISTGLGTVTTTGTGAGASGGATNYLTEQPRSQTNSATTANAQAGFSWPAVGVAVASSTAGRGGWCFTARFGAAQLPTGPRLFVGMTGATFVADTTDPSAKTANYAGIGKDSADTNLQLLVNSNASTGTKTDTGIAWVANGWYEVTIWANPGSLTVYCLLIRLDTGAIWFGSTATDVPTDGAAMFPQAIGSLASSTGTALQFCLGSLSVRAGG